MSLFARPPINLLTNFDEELQNFYRRVLLEEENVKSRKAKNQVGKKAEKKKAKTQVERKEKQGKAKKRASKISSEKQANISSKTSSEKQANISSKTSSEADILSKTDSEMKAYVFRYGPCCASAVAHHFLSMVNNNPQIFRNALWKRRVEICCLGGASSSEVVAISKIFSSAQDWFWLSTRKPLHLQVTIVGNNREETIPLMFRLQQALKQTACLFDAAKMDISFRFLWADLTKPLNSDVESVLKEADIVTMVKFLSAVCLPSSGKAWLVQDIAAKMKTDAVLFYLDTGVNRQCHLLHTSLRSLNDIKCIYGPVQLEAFRLTPDSIHRCVQLFWHKFENICLPSFIINTCAWVKSEGGAAGEISAHPLQDLKELSGYARRQKLREINRQWQKRALASQEIMLTHRRKVRHVLPKKKKRFVKEDPSLEKELDSLLKEETDFLNYPGVKDKVLFQTKSKDRRIFLRSFVKKDINLV